MKVRIWLLRATVTLLSFILALLAAELALRSSPAGGGRKVTLPDIHEHDPLLGWSLDPGTQARHRTPELDVTVRINSQGFRADRDYALEPAPETRRVVAVGDSFTFGQGVEAHEAFPAILERRLERTEVINLGVPGYGLDQQLLMLEGRGLLYRPDLILVGLHTPDVFRSTRASYGRYAKPVFRFRGGRLELTNVPVPPPGTPPPPVRGLDRSHVYRLISVRLERRGFGEVWDLTRSLFGRMAARAAEAEARLMVLLLPPKYGVYGSPLERRSQAGTTGRIAGILRELGIEHHDLTPALDGRAEREVLFYPEDQHFTPAGHRVVAEEVFERLTSG